MKLKKIGTNRICSSIKTEERICLSIKRGEGICLSIETEERICLSIETEEKGIFVYFHKHGITKRIKHHKHW